jgi:hypothetical protein
LVSIFGAGRLSLQKLLPRLRSYPAQAFDLGPVLLPDPPCLLAGGRGLAAISRKLLPQLGELGGMAAAIVHGGTTTPDRSGGAAAICIFAWSRERVIVADEIKALESHLAQLCVDPMHRYAAIRIPGPMPSPSAAGMVSPRPR